MNCVLLVLVSLVCLVLSNVNAHAQSSYLTAFRTRYPATAGTKLDVCQVCHGASTSQWNPYGQAIRSLGSGVNITTRITNVESLDSDGDGINNVTEINGITFPGDPADPPSAPVAPTISTASPLPGGTVGTAYSQALAATGGTSPYSWSVSAGTLPAGLSLSPAGVLSGTPTAQGGYNFTVRVTGNNGASSTKPLSLTINTVAAVTLTSLAINGPSSVNESGTATYTATAGWSDGTTSTVTPTTWGFNPATTFASISASGVMTTQAVTSNQSVTVSASYTFGAVTRSDTQPVTIVNVMATLTGLTINGPSSVNESGTATYTATASWSDGSTSTVTPTTWGVSPATLTSINASGVLTTQAVDTDQTATVTASYTFGGVTRLDTQPVTITASAINPPASATTASTSTADTSSSWGCAVAGRNATGDPGIDGFLILAPLGLVAWRIRRRKR